MAAKLCAVALLPVGDAAERCVRELLGHYAERSWFEILVGLTALLMAAAFIAWAFALCLYVFRAPA